MGFLDKLRERISVSDTQVEGDEPMEEYVELETEHQPEHRDTRITVRPYVIDSFDNVKPILDVLREGSTIALINIKPLKDKDIIELKRAINKLKKTCDAIEGDIAGFGENWIAATPAFASIHRGAKPESSVEHEQPPQTSASEE